MKMITVQESKDVLKEGYLKAGLKLESESLDTLYFDYEGGKIKIEKEDIKNYRKFYNLKLKYQTEPCECSIMNTNYREQIVSFLNLRNRIFRRHRKNIFIFGDKSTDEVYLEISSASDDFVNHFRFQEQYLEQCLPMFELCGDEDIDIDEQYEEMFGNLYRPVTIKAFNLNESSLETATTKSTDLIDRCLFSISSLKENPVELLEEWLTRKKGVNSSKDFVFGERIRGNTLPIPKIKLNPVLIRFHQQATSTDIPSLKYLAYYQILEYFFVKVADEQLYNSLSRRINDLKFKTSSSNLDKIINDVTNHKRDNDETEMMKNVMKKYINEDNLIEFIKTYETYLDKKIYTSKRVVFGTSIAATALNTGHIFGNISKTIKAIRNALVHSSDRYERNARYIPYSKIGTKLIQDELPLIKFLAEKLIISSEGLQ